MTTQLRELLDRHKPLPTAPNQHHLDRARMQQPPLEPRPLPTPPAAGQRLPYPNTYGPSSTIRPQPGGMNAHEAVYGGAGAQVHEDWIPYAGAPTGRGSTFFVSGSGTQRLGGGDGRSGPSKRKPLPIPIGRPAGQQQQPQFTAQTAYSPPYSPQKLPPGAMPSTSPPRRPAPQPSSPPPASPYQASYFPSCPVPNQLTVALPDQNPARQLVVGDRKSVV